VRQHLGLGEAAHLRAHLRQRLVQPGIAEGRDGRLRGDELGQPRLQAIVSAGVDEIADLLLEPTDLRAGYAQCRQPHGLALAYGDAAGDLGQVLAERSCRDQTLELAQSLRGLELPRPTQHLPQRLNVGRQPREPVRGRLGGIEAARRIHRLAHAGFGEVEEPLGGRHRVLIALQVEPRARLHFGTSAGDGHGLAPSLVAPKFAGLALCCTAQ
jgi:hypothetical protein